MPILSVSGGPLVLQSAATTGPGRYLPLKGNANDLTVVVEATGTITGGAISIEEAYWKDDAPPYSGTWSVIKSLTGATDFTSNAQTVFHANKTGPSSFWAVRARISSDITGGGTVTVTAWGNS